MVDSTDAERFKEARDELHGILDSDEMRGVPVVVMANKQDLPRKFNTSGRYQDADTELKWRITFLGRHKYNS